MMRAALPWIIALAAAALPLLLIADPVQARAVALAAFALALWLGEAVPPFVPTLLLLGAVPVAMRGAGADYAPAAVLRWAAEPVLALFLGGFAIGAAAQRHGLDTWIADRALGLSGGSRGRLLALVLGASAFLSMWMSNTAAAALLISALRPLTSALGTGDRYRAGLIVAVAMGANIGGMATPIGTGPNAIAISHLPAGAAMTFAGWMAMALPLCLGLLAALWLLLAWRHQARGTVAPALAEPRLTPGGIRTVVVVGAMIAAWLTEPFHGLPAASVALGGAGILFASGLLDRNDLGRIDWSTLLLVAGGLILGQLLEKSGAMRDLSGAVAWDALPSLVRLWLLVMACATISALMSNTAAAVLLIPLGMTLVPDPSTPLLIAIAASLGAPFAISTPPNALAVGEGGVRSADLLWPGLLLMIPGGVLLTLTGPWWIRLTVGS